jgi:uncharacterized SAM-binding protein YcdF (DUF218 family)
MSHKRLTVVFVLFSFVLSAIVLSAAALHEAGPWLVASDPEPDSLDMLFTFGGDLDRYYHSKTIMRRHPDAFWVISVGSFPVFDTLTLATIARRNTALGGFDTSRIIVNDTATSTGAEITILHALIRLALGKSAPVLAVGAPRTDSLWFDQQHVLRSYFAAHLPADSVLDIGLVSHPFHMRRIKLLARAATQGLPVRLHLLPVGHDSDIRAYLRRRRWWRSETHAAFVISEYIKLAYYFTMRGRVRVRP